MNKNHFNKIKIIILACILALVPFFTACACLESNLYVILPSTEEELFNRYAPSVVTIEAAGQKGTGFLYYIGANSIYFVTNHHVLEDYLDNNSVPIILRFFSDPYNILYGLPVSVVGYEEYFDIAVLRVSGINHTSIGYRPLINNISNHTAHATPLLALGNLDGAGVSAFGGLMSNPNRILDFGVGYDLQFRFRPLQQISVNLNAGTSGGPVLDMHGRLVGISGFQQPFDNQGIPLIGVSFSIAAPVASTLIRRAILLDTGTNIPKLAIHMENINTLFLSSFGGVRLRINAFGEVVVIDGGTRVSATTGEWLNEGDIITNIGGIDLVNANYTTLFTALAGYAHQSSFINANINLNTLSQLNITFIRDNVAHTLSFMHFFR